MEIIFTGLSRKKADLVLLILASQSIDAVLKEKGPCFSVLVRAAHKPAARQHVAAYEQENLCLPGFPPALAHPGFFSWTMVWAMAVIACAHILVTRMGLHDTAVFRFGASPYFLGQAGQTFRAITALFFHADAGHLLGNLAGLFVFGGPLVRLTGPGTGLFLLVCAAATGNLVSNSFQENARLSIGASTAVMGAAGLLAAWQLTRPAPFARFKGLVSLAGAATLMALFSHGQATDVSAHFFGFLSGAAIGLPAFPLFRIWTQRAGPGRVEPLFLALTLALVTAAFLSGIAA